MFSPQTGRLQEVFHGHDGSKIEIRVCFPDKCTIWHCHAFFLGRRGSQGSKGKLGRPGLSVPGTYGNPGEPGLIGLQGITGLPGPKGHSGRPGISGVPGKDSPNTYFDMEIKSVSAKRCQSCFSKLKILKYFSINSFHISLRSIQKTNKSSFPKWRAYLEAVVT